MGKNDISMTVNLSVTLTFVPNTILKGEQVRNNSFYTSFYRA